MISYPSRFNLCSLMFLTTTAVIKNDDFNETVNDKLTKDNTHFSLLAQLNANCISFISMDIKPAT